MNDQGNFLGQGWHFPPSFSNKAIDVEMVQGSENVHQSILLILGTRTGERFFQEDFGTPLDDFLFNPVGQYVLNAISQAVQEALLKHEPRIQVEIIQVLEDPTTQGRINIHLTYTVRETNSRYNMVYPYYLNEGA